MANVKIELSTSWAAISTQNSVITILTIGEGLLRINYTQDDDTAYRFTAPVGRQFVISSSGTQVYARCDSSLNPYVILVDGVA